MSKFLLFLCFLGGLWWWFKRGPRSGVEAAPPAVRPVESMVACRRCGVHLPDSEARLSRDGGYYCPEHIPAGERE